MATVILAQLREGSVTAAHNCSLRVLHFTTGPRFFVEDIEFSPAQLVGTFFTCGGRNMQQNKIQGRFYKNSGGRWIDQGSKA